MSATPHLDACRAARVPREGLAVLAPLRHMTNVRVVELGHEAWVSWEGEMPSVVSALLAVEGARFYRPSESGWQMLDQALPDFTVPRTQESLPLDRAVVPEPCVPITLANFRGKRIPISIVACDRPRPTAALRCHCAALMEWSDRAPTAEIEALSGAWSGTNVWLRGRLPALLKAERFWGERVLAPLGFRAEPDWPDAALRQAALVDDDEILVLTAEEPEAISLAAFRKLTRASIRRLLQSLPPCTIPKRS